MKGYLLMKNKIKYIIPVIAILAIVIIVMIRNSKPFDVTSKKIMLSDLKPGQTAILIKESCPTCQKYKSKINKLLHDKSVYYADMTDEENIKFVKDNIKENVTVPSKLYFDKTNNQIIFTNEQYFISLIN